jgi:hypothetical protein
LTTEKKNGYEKESFESRELKKNWSCSGKIGHRLVSWMKRRRFGSGRQDGLNVEVHRCRYMLQIPQVRIRWVVMRATQRKKSAFARAFARDLTIENLKRTKRLSFDAMKEIEIEIADEGPKKTKRSFCDERKEPEVTDEMLRKMKSTLFDAKSESTTAAG